MTELLDRDIDVEVVFAVNDVMAVGATAALRDQGYRVPQDMAIAGFDDISTLRDVRPALTTVRLPLIDMGRQALELALDRQSSDRDSEPAQRVVRVAADVVIRESTPRLG